MSTEADIVERHTFETDQRCPTCNLSWWLFPPAKITDADWYRCVECKEMFKGSTVIATSGKDAT